MKTKQIFFYHNISLLLKNDDIFFVCFFLTILSLQKEKQLLLTHLHTALCRTRCSFRQKSFSTKLVWTILCTRTWFFCNHICRYIIICNKQKQYEKWHPFLKIELYEFGKLFKNFKEQIFWGGRGRKYHFYIKFQQKMLDFYFISYFKINFKIDHIFKYKKENKISRRKENYF